MKLFGVFTAGVPLPVVIVVTVIVVTVIRAVMVAAVMSIVSVMMGRAAVRGRVLAGEA